jgi:hypothetical protein
VKLVERTNGECLKENVNEFEADRKKINIRDLYRGINEFKKRYRPGSNLVKDESGDLLSDFHSIIIEELLLSAIGCTLH